MYKVTYSLSYMIYRKKIINMIIYLRIMSWLETEQYIAKFVLSYAETELSLDTNTKF